MKRFLRTASAGALLAVLAACSTTSPDVVKREDAQRLAQVEDAVVLNVRPVVVDGSQSGAGAATGAVIGGVGGSAVGGSREQVIVGVVGAVVGGVVGNAVERFGTREDANEILLQMSNGQRRSIIQAKGNEAFKPGDPVLLVTTSGKVRVMRAPPIR
jgi:outer membrane lipoprotein SlyB